MDERQRKKIMDVEMDLKRRESMLAAKSKALMEKEAELNKRAEGVLRLEEEARHRALVSAKQDIADAAALRRGHDQKVRELVKELLVKSAREQRALNAAKLSADSMRVGRVSYVRSGMSVNEYWERGGAWDDLQMRREQLDKEKDALEKDRKAFQKRCKTAGGGGGSGAAGGGGMQPPPVPSDEQQEQEEIFRLRAQKFKDKEKLLADEKEKLEREKSTLIRELKRSQDQLRSKYNSFPLLNQRYLLLHLLGKGGFSEVWSSFDLQELREVACKIHELNPHWSDEKKTNYMKHATREYEIQKKLCHPRIVRLIDVFEGDHLYGNKGPS